MQLGVSMHASRLSMSETVLNSPEYSIYIYISPVNVNSFASGSKKQARIHSNLLAAVTITRTSLMTLTPPYLIPRPPCRST